MSSKEHLARKAAVIELFRSFTSAQSLGIETVETYARALDKYPVEAVKRACERFTDPEFRRKDQHWHPSAVEVAAQAAMYAPRPANDQIKLYNGLIDMDWGSGKVSLAGLTTEEQDRVIALKGRAADGRNLAGLALVDLRDAINQPALPLGREMPKPQIRRMT